MTTHFILCCFCFYSRGLEDHLELETGTWKIVNYGVIIMVKNYCLLAVSAEETLYTDTQRWRDFLGIVAIWVILKICHR